MAKTTRTIYQQLLGNLAKPSSHLFLHAEPMVAVRGIGPLSAHGSRLWLLWFRRPGGASPQLHLQSLASKAHASDTYCCHGAMHAELQNWTLQQSRRDVMTYRAAQSKAWVWKGQSCQPGHRGTNALQPTCTKLLPPSFSPAPGQWAPQGQH